jgi:hypothetical protein
MVQKLVQKMTPKNVKFKPILGPKMDPKMGYLGGQPARAQEAGAILKALVSKMPQAGSRRPRIAQDSLLGAFLGLQKLLWKALEPQKP